VPSCLGHQYPSVVRKARQGAAPTVVVRPVSRVGEVASRPLSPTERSALPAFASAGVENSPSSTHNAHSLGRLSVLPVHQARPLVTTSTRCGTARLIATGFYFRLSRLKNDRF
jgi:hypothetical protein